MRHLLTTISYQPWGQPHPLRTQEKCPILWALEVNKGKAKGRGHSSMALQGLPANRGCCPVDHDRGQGLSQDSQPRLQPSHALPQERRGCQGRNSLLRPCSKRNTARRTRLHTHQVLPKGGTLLRTEVHLRHPILAVHRPALIQCATRTHAGYLVGNNRLTPAGVGVELLASTTLVRDARATAEFLSTWALAHLYLPRVWTLTTACSAFGSPCRSRYGGQRAPSEGC